MLEKAPDQVGFALVGFHRRTKARLEFFMTRRGRLIAHLRLDRVVEVFVGIDVGAVRRNEKQFDLRDARLDPFAHLDRSMNAEIIDNKEHLVLGRLDQPGEEKDERVRLQCSLVDHEAHIAVHMAAIQDPKIQQLVGQSPMAQQIMAAMAAHIQEHVAFEYRRQIELQAGVPLPPPDSDMSEEVELQISRLAAAAAGQLLQKNKAEMQMQQNQQMQQDPIMQMQMAELELKKGELELKRQKMQVDAAEKNDRLELEEKRIAAQKEIAGLQVGAKIATDKANLSAKQQEAGLRIGVEIAREAVQTAKTPPKLPVSNAPPKENE